jgi:hypothetical protein
MIMVGLSEEQLSECLSAVDGTSEDITSLFSNCDEKRIIKVRVAV